MTASSKATGKPVSQTKVAFNLCYSGVYKLDGFWREGIGVYIGKLAKALLRSESDITIYIITMDDCRNNTSKFLEFFDLSNVEVLTSRADFERITNPVLSSATISQRVLPSKATRFNRLDLNLHFWLPAIRHAGEATLKIKFFGRADSLFSTTHSKRSLSVELEANYSTRPEPLASSIVVVTKQPCAQQFNVDFAIDVSTLTGFDELCVTISQIEDIGYTFVFGLSAEVTPIGESVLTRYFGDTDILTLASNTTLDAIVYHHPLTYEYAICKPSVYHIHDILFFEHGDLFLKTIGGEALEREHLNCRRALSAIKPGSSLIFTSEHVRDSHIKPRFSALLRNNSSEIIRNCVVDASSYEKTDKSLHSPSFQATLSSYTPYVTYPTQARVTKQLDMLLKIVESLRRAIPNLSLILTSELSSYCNLHKEEVPPYVHFFPSLSEEDLYLLYRNAIMSIVTSAHEASLPWQYLESWAAGTPSICFASTIVREFQRQGFLAQPIADRTIFVDAEEGYAKALDIWMKFKDPEFNYSYYIHETRTILKNGLPIASWEEIARNYRKVINQCTNKQ